MNPYGQRARQQGYWKKPHLFRDRTENGGGVLLLGPLQINWYGEGFRVYLTWPGRTRTLLGK
jgi:hypothetical protein